MRIVVALLLLVCTRQGLAQATDPPPDLRSGQRVRVTAPAHAWERADAYVVGMRADTLVLLRPGAAEARLLPGQVTRLEVLVRPRTRGMTLRGIAIGGLIGFVGAKLYLDGAYENDEWNAAGALVVGMPLGMLVGGLTGRSLGAERWIDRPLPPARSSASPGAGRDVQPGT